MDKKVECNIKKVVIDDAEDLEIRCIAYENGNYFPRLLIIFILLLIVILVSSFIFVNSYSKYKNDTGMETIEIKTNKNNILITNISDIKENITSASFNKTEDYIVEKINTITIKTVKEEKKDSKILIDIKYNIKQNDFTRNELAKNDSEVVARFSYSFDGVNWTYTNNVISTDESTIIPLMGNYYDIAGIESNLKIATNYEIVNKSGETTKMYWRSETVFKNKKYKNNSNKFEAEFKIEYKDTNQ